MSQIADLACPLTCQDKLLTRCHAESACRDVCHISDHWEQSKTFGIKIEFESVINFETTAFQLQHFLVTCKLYRLIKNDAHYACQ